MWSPSACSGIDRQRANINVFTRMRYCDVARAHRVRREGRARHAAARAVSVVRGARPRQARHPHRLRALVDARPFAGHGVYAIDTGCVWGGKLTALRLDGEEPQYITVNAEPHRKRPPGGED